MQDYEHASRDEYESTFNEIEVALRDMDAYEDWQETFEQAKAQTLEDESMDTETQAGFARMLTRLYAESSELQAARREDRKDLEDQVDRAKDNEDEDQEYASKREAYQTGNREQAYKHDQDALLDGMDLLGTLSDTVSAAELQDEAEEQRERSFDDDDGYEENDDKREAKP